MEKTIFRINIFLFLLLTTVSTIFAQQQSQYSLGVTGGTMLYYGDLTDDYPQIKNYTEIAYGLQLERALSPKTSLRLSASKGQIRYNDRTINDKGELLTDNPNFNRSLNFQTDIQDASLAFVFHSTKHRAFIRPYFSLGFGITQFDVFGDLLDAEGASYDFEGDPTLEQDGNFETDLRELDIEEAKYDKTTWHIPLGLGLQFRLSPNVHFNLETNLKYAFTDHLDDVETRGNDNGWNDIYAYTQAGLVFSFGSKKTKNTYKAPKIIVGEYATQKNPIIPPNPSSATPLPKSLPLPSAPTAEPVVDTTEPIVATAPAAEPAASLPKKGDKKAAKMNAKNCLEGCAELTTKAERKACKKQCKAAKKEETSDALPNPSNHTQTPANSNETASSNSTTPNPNTPNTIPLSENNTNVPTSASKDCEDVSALKAQLAAIQLELAQLKQNPHATPTTVGAQNFYDPVVELYKLEADRLREDNSNTKIIHEIQQLRNEVAGLKNGTIASNTAPTPSMSTPAIGEAPKSPKISNSETAVSPIEEKENASDLTVGDITAAPLQTKTDSTGAIVETAEIADAIEEKEATSAIKTKAAEVLEEKTDVMPEVATDTPKAIEEDTQKQKNAAGKKTKKRKSNKNKDENCCLDENQNKKKFNFFGLFQKKGAEQTSSRNKEKKPFFGLFQKKDSAQKTKVKKEKKPFDFFGLLKKKSNTSDNVEQ